MKKNSGYTLIEVMTVIVILAILSSIATPALRSTIRANALSAAVNDVYLSLLYAKNVASTRPVQVSITTNGTWRDGFSVTDADDVVLLSKEGFHEDVTVDSGAPDPIVFGIDGQTANTGAIQLRSTVTGGCRRIQILGSGNVLITDCE